MPVVPLIAILFLLSCDGAYPESRLEAYPQRIVPVVDPCEDPAEVKRLRQGLQSQCVELNPVVETDVTSPDFGAATCWVIEARDIAEHPDFCDCQEQGYAALSDQEQEAAIALVKADAPSVAQCSIDQCFCEFQQLSGAELQACQSGTPISSDGWCYVAPERGVGEVAALQRSNAKYCPHPEGIAYTGDLLDGARYISCWR